MIWLFKRLFLLGLVIGGLLWLGNKFLTVDVPYGQVGITTGVGKRDVLPYGKHIKNPGAVKFVKLHQVVSCDIRTRTDDLVPVTIKAYAVCDLNPKNIPFEIRLQPTENIAILRDWLQTAIVDMAKSRTAISLYSDNPDSLSLEARRRFRELSGNNMKVSQIKVTTRLHDKFIQGQQAIIHAKAIADVATTQAASNDLVIPVDTKRLAEISKMWLEAASIVRKSFELDDDKSRANLRKALDLEPLDE